MPFGRPPPRQKGAAAQAGQLVDRLGKGAGAEARSRPGLAEQPPAGVAPVGVTRAGLAAARPGSVPAGRGEGREEEPGDGPAAAVAPNAREPAELWGPAEPAGLPERGRPAAASWDRELAHPAISGCARGATIVTPDPVSPGTGFAAFAQEAVVIIARDHCGSHGGKVTGNSRRVTEAAHPGNLWQCIRGLEKSA